MTTFSQAVATDKSQEVSYTENGMKAWATSDSVVLDLFGKIGSARGKDLTNLFSAALAEDENLAIRTLLWARDIRGGSGEREIFRSLMRVLEKMNPALAGRLLHKIPLLGRWDDVLYVYSDPFNRNNALNFYSTALTSGDKLAAKWAPRIVSSKKAITENGKKKLAAAKALAHNLGLSFKDYRKLISSNTDAVEQKMSAKKWDDINFSHVPSLASARYQKAFGKNAAIAYSAYIRELQKPEEQRDPNVKINAGAIYPYDVIKSLKMGNEAVANAQFDALPNFLGDAKIMPMVDVSESMNTLLAGGLNAMDIALSLGLYLSHHSNSDFKNMFITFTDTATIQTLSGSLSQKIRQLRGNVGYSTNLSAAFNSLLETAVRNNVEPENMPSYLLILSDMQFDDYSITGKDATSLEMARNKYKNAGYSMPNIIYWNLTARADNTPIKMGDNGTCLVSGFSPNIMKSILGASPEEFSPYKMMLKVLEDNRYSY